ncbi:SDR family oxidoreductase [Nakamurella flavida]|uniref:SDR family oxidoreductase n=1 Tax=Nakamurella flavida TaxID=363630 RepID=A0A938YHD8_9ACTN|nr:SDR family oxidoreductase [Nakamurella flavida]MBM9475972.1 SDR family oxidoreductase [Nakamurella flavida]MBM9478368.1 SDR family oxidoreductase [Nakamurella flavida]MDP9777739.1 NAD(P)-dependent dehydrogenase (short-subunit alcohol dehydrogenase family) [Nakamurella flavida]
MTTALITGANRGLGRHFATELLARGATVYAGARDPATIDLPGVRPLALDITDPDAVTAAAALAGDVDLLINNAGISTGARLLGDLAGVRAEMDVNFWGTLAMVRAFAPVLATNGGGRIITIASALSWFAAPGAGAYAVSKAANWNMSNALRLELAGQGTQVTSVHLGLADTDMAEGIQGPKTDPAVVARRTLDAAEAGEIEVVVDEWSAMVKASLAQDPRAFYDRFRTT